jgi:hypothetical protein
MRRSLLFASQLREQGVWERSALADIGIQLRLEYQSAIKRFSGIKLPSAGMPAYQACL